MKYLLLETAVPRIITHTLLVSKTGISQLAGPQSLQLLLCSDQSPQLSNARVTGPCGSAECHLPHIKTERMYMMTETKRNRLTS